MKMRVLCSLAFWFATVASGQYDIVNDNQPQELLMLQQQHNQNPTHNNVRMNFKHSSPDGGNGFRIRTMESERQHRPNKRHKKHKNPKKQKRKRQKRHRKAERRRAESSSGSESYNPHLQQSMMNPHHPPQQPHQGYNYGQFPQAAQQVQPQPAHYAPPAPAPAPQPVAYQPNFMPPNRGIGDKSGNSMNSFPESASMGGGHGGFSDFGGDSFGSATSDDGDDDAKEMFGSSVGDRQRAGKHTVSTANIVDSCTASELDLYMRFFGEGARHHFVLAFDGA